MLKGLARAQGLDADVLLLNEATRPTTGPFTEAGDQRIVGSRDAIDRSNPFG